MAIHKIKIFTGRDSEYLAKKIAASFGTTLGQSEVLRFSDGEFQPCYNCLLYTSDAADEL